MKKVLLTLILLGTVGIQASSHEKTASVTKKFNCPGCPEKFSDAKSTVDHMLATGHSYDITEEKSQMKSRQVGSVSPADSGIASGRSSAASAVLSPTSLSFYEFYNSDEEEIEPTYLAESDDVLPTDYPNYDSALDLQFEAYFEGKDYEIALQEAIAQQPEITNDELATLVREYQAEQAMLDDDFDLSMF